jgi:transketolase
MRKECAQLLLDEMSANDRIRVVTADLGFGILDHVRNAYPDRFYNVGAAEQLMIGVAVGMAQSATPLIPVCYSMSSFLLYRPFEFLRNYVSYEKAPVKLLGSGRDRDYSHDGITHWAHDDEQVLSALPNIKIYKPNSLAELEQMWPEYIASTEPAYLSLRRSL